jgi:uncharacterized protein
MDGSIKVENLPNRATATIPKRGKTYRVMRQLHLWIGAWGAVAAILFGATGFIQNHRGMMKLPQGDSTDLSKVQIEVPETARATPEALRDWLRDTQHVPVDSFRAQPGGPTEMGGQKMRGAGKWTFNGGNARIVWTAEYVPGNATVEVRNVEQSPLATLIRLHKGVAGSALWILLTDTFAIGMVMLGISGIVMWGRGRSARQMAFSVFGVAVLVLLIVGGAVVI